MVLAATLTATYPKTEPILNLERATNVRSKAIDQIKLIVSTLPKTLLGEVMMYEIATAIQDILDDSVSVQASQEGMASLEEERAEREAAAAKLAQQQELEAARRQAELQAEEEKALQRMMEEEIKRREETRRRRQTSSEAALTEIIIDRRPDVVFDQDIVVSSDDANPITFRAIAIMAGIGQVQSHLSLPHVLSFKMRKRHQRA